ncbi:MAG: thioredoxin family protein [Acidiferrobacterales bacterium]
MKATKPEVGRDGNPKSIRAGNHPGDPWRAVIVQLAGLLGLLLSLVVPLAAAAGLPVARNLHADGQLAARERLPVLVFFYAHSCAYCKEVDELYLQPRYADAAYRKKVIFREVNIRSGRALRDFSGKMTSAAAFASRYGVSLTPTIKLLDAHGREVVPSLVGVASPDFYGSYLDAAVAAADNKLRTDDASSPTAFVRVHRPLR